MRVVRVEGVLGDMGEWFGECERVWGKVWGDWEWGGLVDAQFCFCRLWVVASSLHQVMALWLMGLKASENCSPVCGEQAEGLVCSRGGLGEQLLGAWWWEGKGVWLKCRPSAHPQRSEETSNG